MTPTERDALFKDAEELADNLDYPSAERTVRSLLSLARTAPDNTDLSSRNPSGETIRSTMGGATGGHGDDRMVAGSHGPLTLGCGVEREIEGMQVVQGLRRAALRTTWEQDGGSTWEKPHPDKALFERAASFILGLLTAAPVEGGWSDVARVVQKYGIPDLLDELNGRQRSCVDGRDITPGKFHDASVAADKLRAALLAASPLLSGLGFDEPVDFYEREFYPLSNFSAFRLEWKGLTFDTSEAAYQWEKFVDTNALVAQLIHGAPSAHEAFKTAERYATYRREDWDSVKIDIMRQIIRAKADQHEYVRRKLLETGGALLVEGSWRDRFWGTGPNGDGQNMLGKLWMEFRSRNPSSERGEG